jgi:hypothetical protein
MSTETILLLEELSDSIQERDFNDKHDKQRALDVVENCINKTLESMDTDDRINAAQALYTYRGYDDNMIDDLMHQHRLYCLAE